MSLEELYDSMDFNESNENNEKKILAICKSFGEKWKIKLIDTGFDTDTGARIKKIQEYIKIFKNIQKMHKNT